MNVRHEPPPIIATLRQLRVWLSVAPANDRRIYHLGQMQFDRKFSQDLHERGQVIMLLSELGYVMSTARRYDEGIYLYEVSRTDKRDVPKVFTALTNKKAITAEAYRVLMAIHEPDPTGLFSVTRKIQRGLNITDARARRWLAEMRSAGLIEPVSAGGWQLSRKGQNTLK